MSREGPYWFRAKTHGLGWGLPTCWQGWTVLLVLLGPLIVASVLSVTALAVLSFPLLVTFVLIVVRTGDPAGRHWR